MSDIERERLFNYLADDEIRPIFISDHIREQIALQIRTMREKRQWTQTELGEHAGIPQPRISLLEDPDYSGLTLATLKRIAQAFDVGLIVRFASFGEVADWTVNLEPKQLTPPSYGEERQMALAEAPGGHNWTKVGPLVIVGGASAYDMRAIPSEPSSTSSETPDIGWYQGATLGIDKPRGEGTKFAVAV